MKNLDNKELISINGGGPIGCFIEAYYNSMGSFWYGVYDGIMGNEPKVE